jgi:hypothetical protein
MVQYNISVVNEVSGRLRQFGSDQDKILKKILRRIAGKYRTFLRRHYLRGQMLGRRTGETYRNTRVRKVRRRDAYRVAPPLANIYEHPGGATIRPKDAQVLRWFDRSGEPQFAKEVNLPRIPFVTRSYERFDWKRETFKNTNDVIMRELRKRGIANG